MNKAERWHAGTRCLALLSLHHVTNSPGRIEEQVKECVRGAMKQQASIGNLRLPGGSGYEIQEDAKVAARTPLADHRREIRLLRLRTPNRKGLNASRNAGSSFGAHNIVMGMRDSGRSIFTVMVLAGNSHPASVLPESCKNSASK